MTSRTRLTAARIAVRVALARHQAELDAAAPAKLTGAIATARVLTRKSRLARILNGSGDLWNGSDRAHQFALLNAAADTRRLAVRTFIVRGN
jgi:hypothetical protein